MKKGTFVSTPRGNGIYIGDDLVYIIDRGTYERVKRLRREVKIDFSAMALPSNVLDLAIRRYTRVVTGNGIEIRTPKIEIKATPDITTPYCKGEVCLYFVERGDIMTAVLIDRIME